MAETIVKGYLINKINYQIFDEVITFLGEDSKKYSCLSMGSKKIMSKNSRNLFSGYLIEFEFFQARDEEKLSRLKKANIVENPEWLLDGSRSLMLLNEVTVYTKYSPTLFSYYQSMLNEIKNGKNNEELFILKCLRNFCKTNGISLEVNKCIRCGSKILKTISFKHNGMLCNECCKVLNVKSFDLDFTKLMHYLFNDDYKSLKHYAALFPLAIKLLREYIFDIAGIKLLSIKEY